MIEIEKQKVKENIKKDVKEENTILDYLKINIIISNDKIQNAICLMIIKDFQPFSILEDTGFKSLIKLI